MRLILKAREGLVKKVITNKKGHKTTVWVRSNKKTNIGESSKRSSIDDTLKKVLSDFEYYPNGNIKSGWLENNTTVSINGQDIKIEGQDVVRFHPNGVIENVDLNGAQIINGAKYKDSMSVYFHDNEIIREGYLHDDQKVQGVNYNGNSFLYTHRNGNVKSGLSVGNNVVDGKKYKDLTYFEFNSNGKLKSAKEKKDPEKIRARGKEMKRVYDSWTKKKESRWLKLKKI